VVVESVEPDVPELANPDDRWSPSWLPVGGLRFPVVIDCSVPAGAPTPVRLVSLEHVGPSPPVAASLGEVVTWWIAAIDNGAWRWDTTHSVWKVENDLLDQGSRNNLVFG
jgi:hypothetical protein